MLAHQPNNSAHIAESAVGRSNGLQISLSLSKRTSNPDVRTVWKDDTEGAKVTMVSSAGSMLWDNTSALMYRWTCCSRTPPRPSSPLLRRRKKWLHSHTILEFWSIPYSSNFTTIYPFFVNLNTFHQDFHKYPCCTNVHTTRFRKKG